MVIDISYMEMVPEAEIYLFMINNKLIVNRRKIANEFSKVIYNKYFGSLASKMNSSVTENGEIMVAKLEPFRCYLSTK